MDINDGSDVPPLPHTARPRTRRHFPPNQRVHAGIDAHTALARAHETISVLCDELDEARTEQSGRAPVSPSNFQAVREDRDQWRDTAHDLSTRHARAVQQRRDLEGELGELKRALAVLAGGGDE